MPLLKKNVFFREKSIFFEISSINGDYIKYVKFYMEGKTILKLKIHMGEIMRLNVHMGISWWKNIVCQNIIHKWWLRQICEKFVQNDIISWESDDFVFECIFNRWFPVFDVCRVQKVLKYAEEDQNYFLPIKIFSTSYKS